jgi:hypothetical protein
MCTQVRKHRECLVGLAESHFISEYDSSLFVDKQAAQRSGNDTLLVTMTSAEWHFRDKTLYVILGGQRAAPLSNS